MDPDFSFTKYFEDALLSPEQLIALQNGPLTERIIREVQSSNESRSENERHAQTASTSRTLGTSTTDSVSQSHSASQSRSIQDVTSLDRSLRNKQLDPTALKIHSPCSCRGIFIRSRAQQLGHQSKHHGRHIREFRQNRIKHRRHQRNQHNGNIPQHGNRAQ